MKYLTILKTYKMVWYRYEFARAVCTRLHEQTACNNKNMNEGALQQEP